MAVEYEDQNLRDCGSFARSLSLEFDLLGLPNTLFFDARGRLVRTHVGEVLEADLVAYLAALQE